MYMINHEVDMTLSIAYCAKIHRKIHLKMDARLQQYLVEVEKVDALKKVYMLSQKQRDDLFDEITSDMNCTPYMLNCLKVSNFQHKVEKSINDVLIAASSTGNIDMVRLCIAKNGKDPFYNALSYAAKSGHPDVVELLRNTFEYPSSEIRQAEHDLYRRHCTSGDYSLTDLHWRK